MSEKELIISGGAMSEMLSEEEEKTLQTKLWRLLARRTELYTMGESSSVRVETAQELLQSILFCLNLYLKRSGNTRKLLVKGELEELFALGLKAVEEELETGRRLYNTTCLTAPKIENISYKDTLVGIGEFFKRYDYRYFAHQIPCDIDYQLCHPVDVKKQGIEYINEYLLHIKAENDFVCKFDNKLAEGLLGAYCSDFRGLLINIYEPLAVNAIGLALLRGDVRSLCITPTEAQRLNKLFEPLSVTPAKKALSDAAKRVCAELGLSDKVSEVYLSKTAQELFPRIEAALPQGNLGGIFLSF